jgi:hypothetical protein
MKVIRIDGAQSDFSTPVRTNIFKIKRSYLSKSGGILK